jgi:acid-sensing ion channel, other
MECFYPFPRTPLDEFDKFYESDGVCKCLPACNSIEYIYEIFEEEYDWYYSEFQYRHTFVFEFRYKDSDYFPMVRYQEFKTKDYLSYVGGLLGLFAGISVLSIIEFFYFFTLRLAVDLINSWRRVRVH